MLKVLDLLAKNMNGWSHKLEIWYVEQSGPALKKTRKYKFYGSSRSLCKYFPNIVITWISNDIWIQLFKSYVQVVPSSLLTSFPQPVWIATDFLAILLLQQTVFNSYPNTNWKWNWKGASIQIFSSEKILAWENGSQGHIFLNFQIPTGLNL